MRSTNTDINTVIRQAVGQVLRGGERVMTVQKMGHTAGDRNSSQNVAIAPAASMDPGNVFFWDYDTFDDGAHYLGP